MNAETFNNPLQVGGHSHLLSTVPVTVAKNYREGDDVHQHELPDVGQGPGKYARMLSLVSLQPSRTERTRQEITPAQALGIIRQDIRYPMLDSRDVEQLTKSLKMACRCYGCVPPSLRMFLPFLSGMSV